MNRFPTAAYECDQIKGDFWGDFMAILNFPSSSERVQGSPFKFTGHLKQVSSAYSETTETCNTGIEREFC